MRHLAGEVRLPVRPIEFQVGQCGTSLCGRVRLRHRVDIRPVGLFLLLTLVRIFQLLGDIHDHPPLCSAYPIVEPLDRLFVPDPDSLDDLYGSISVRRPGMSLRVVT